MERVEKKPGKRKRICSKCGSELKVMRIGNGFGSETKTKCPECRDPFISSSSNGWGRS